MVVVKGNAYGHGMLEFAKHAMDAGANWLGTVSLSEAITLRENGFSLPILILGYVAPADLPLAAEQDIAIPLYHKEYWQEIKEIPFHKPLKVHIKVDTGMHRMGFFPDDPELLPILEEVYEHPNFILEGMYSHLADAENPASWQTDDQIKRFHQLLKSIPVPIRDKMIVHCSNSAATMLNHNSFFNLSRVGISSYGLWASPETRSSLQYLLPSQEMISLHPVLSYRTKIVQIKQVSVGGLIGYCATYRAYRPMKLAIIPVGYYEGLPRIISNRGYFVAGGKPCPVVGNICMNMSFIDITDTVGLKYGDEVVLIGNQGEASVTADDWASWAQTINYEIVTQLPAFINRNYL